MGNGVAGNGRFSSGSGVVFCRFADWIAARALVRQSRTSAVGSARGLDFGFDTTLVVPELLAALFGINVRRNNFGDRGVGPNAERRFTQKSARCGQNCEYCRPSDGNDFGQSHTSRVSGGGFDGEPTRIVSI